MRIRTAAGAAVLVATLAACASNPPAPAPDSAEPVEVTQYGTEMSHGHLVFSAKYTIHNTSRSPITYKIAFKFDGDGNAGFDPKWVTRTVGSQKTYSESTSVPWEGDAASTGVKVIQVEQIPL
ncbi:hypothetical protein [Streptomyces sp. NPDC005281]|uniref:hypothetical protein n=1 Tax=Streptomyces sp. NPDC005281 TaxID=3155712 RepID=UPI0033A236B2